MRILKLVGNIFFIFCTIILTSTFYFALNEKIERPNFKNLSSKGFIFFGIMVFIFIFISIKIILRYFKKSKI